MTSPRSIRMIVAKKAGSLLCLTLFLFLQLLAFAPELHHYLHSDAVQADHQCAVTLLSQGNLHVASGLTSVVSTPVFHFKIPVHTNSAPAMADFLLLPGRAPPLSSSCILAG